jgi:hypothetical protein
VHCYDFNAASSTDVDLHVANGRCPARLLTDLDTGPPTVWGDDAFLDAIGRGEQPDASEVSRVLVGWRDEAHAAPVPELVGTVTATRVVRAGRLPWWYRVVFRVLRWMRGAS